MAITQLGTYSATVNADTTATPNTIVQRDNNGGTLSKIVTGSVIQTTGNYQGTPVAQTASFTAGAATDYLVDTTAASVTVTLPAASANAGYVYNFIKKDATANTITLTGVLGTSVISVQYKSVRVVSDGVNWYGF